MRKFTYTLLAFLFVFALPLNAVTEYDIGGGLTLILYDDGSYEVSAGPMDTSFLVGRQYAFDLDSSLQYMISVILESDPSLSSIDPEVLTDFVLAYSGDYYDMSIQIIFISETELLMTVTFDGEYETTPLAYGLSREGILTIEDAESTTFKFNDDYTVFEMAGADGAFPMRFILVK